jgi:hypothetical protein
MSTGDRLSSLCRTRGIKMGQAHFLANVSTRDSTKLDIPIIDESGETALVQPSEFMKIATPDVLFGS